MPITERSRYGWQHFVALWVFGWMLYLPQYILMSPELPILRPLTASVFSGGYYALAWVLGFKLAMKFRRGRELSGLHLTALVGAVMLLVIATRALQFLVFGPLGYLRPDETFLVVIAEAYTPFTVTHYAALMAATHWLHYQEEFHRSTRRAEALQIQVTTARVQVLQGQLQPHFLFNALNSIAALVRLDPDRAAHAIDRLEHLFTAVTRDHDVSLIPLREEAQLLEAYLSIEKLRFGPRLHVVTSLGADTWNVQVPPLILQPIVENSIRHGAAFLPGRQFVCILAFRDGLDTCIIVRDNGPGIPPDYIEGIGLRNARARLELMEPQGACRMTVRNMPSGGCEVTINLRAGA